MINQHQNQVVAEDHFERYFTEKIWEMIPAFYRTEDGLAENPDVLRSIVEIMAQQAAVVRRSNDRLWEDQFIARCSEWAIPYLADLLGTRLVSALNQRGRRADVSTTIQKRRSAGTLRILEQLISSITDWEGTAKESFRRLQRSPHGLDVHDTLSNASFSSTPPGGLANLRSPRISELIDGPFSEFHHTPDLRQPRGKDGYYGIHKIAFHLYRLKAFPLREVTPFPLPDHPAFDGIRYTFDPSGRQNPLFMPRHRTTDEAQWRPALEWELPGPISCRLLGQVVYRIRPVHIQRLEDNHGLSNAAAVELQQLQQQTFRTEYRLQESLEALANGPELRTPAIYIPLLQMTLVRNCAKAVLLDRAIEVDAGPPEGIIDSARIISGNLSLGTLTAPEEKRLIIDPVHGILQWQEPVPEQAPEVAYYYGFSGNIGAGSYDRRSPESVMPDGIINNGGTIAAANLLNNGAVQINDSRTYGPIGNKVSIQNLTLQAQNRERPYLRTAANWVLNTGANTESFARLDGLWLGATDPGNALVLRGDYECVTIANCTLDPGGDSDLFGDPIHPVELIIEARIDELIIDQSIMGPIRIQGVGLVENLIICDSIVQSTTAGVLAIEQPLGKLQMDRVTVFGEIDVHRLYASETIITGVATVTDTQAGCFRFSVAPSGSRLPRPYPHAPMPFTDSSHWFVSRRFGDPAYAQLSETAPESLLRGAENGSEIGAFSGLLNPIKADSLRIKVAEFLPFGLLPLFINET